MARSTQLSGKTFVRVTKYDAAAHIDEFHLQQGMMMRPEMVYPRISQLFSTIYYSNNPLTSIIGNNVIKVNGEEWTWELETGTYRPLVVVENVEASTTPGRFNTRFKIKFDENFFTPGDVISPGALDTRILVRIMDYPIKSGNGYIYNCMLLSDDPELFVSTRFLEPGTEWSKLFSAYEEGAEQAGSTVTRGKVQYKNRLMTLRKGYQVTGNAQDYVLEIGVKAGDGKIYKSWVKYVEVEAWRQFFMEQEIALWYSRYTESKVPGSTGRPVRTGAGLMEQIESSNRMTYNTLTPKVIEEFLMEMSYGRVLPEERRGKVIYVFTGEYGMLQFNHAMEELVAKNNWVRADGNFAPVQKTTSKVHNNAYQYGYQFVRYQAANGITYEVVHNPIFDLPEFNKELDPLTGKPLSSMQYLFLDISYGRSEGNISIVRQKNNSLSVAYVPGTVSPYGRSSSMKLAAHGGDYYDVVFQDKIGLQVTDNTRAALLIPNRI